MHFSIVVCSRYWFSGIDLPVQNFVISAATMCFPAACGCSSIAEGGGSGRAPSLDTRRSSATVPEHVTQLRPPAAPLRGKLPGLSVGADDKDIGF